MKISKICLLIVACVLLAGCGTLGPKLSPNCNTGDGKVALMKTTETTSTHQINL